MNDAFSVVLADVVTLDSSLPRAAAVLVASGRVVAVGSREAMLDLAPRASVVDRRGLTLTPGLADAHVHLTAYGFTLERLDLSGARSWREATALVAARAAGARPGEWVLGSGYDLNLWGLDGYPLAAWLDEVAPHHPVFLTSRDGHAAWVNSAALRAAGVGVSVPDPAGGRVVRDAGGAPSGTLLESAVGLVGSAVPAPSWESVVAAARRAAEDFARRGFTAVHTMALEPPEYLRAMLELEARGELPLRVWACLPHARLDDAAACGLRGGVGGLVRVSGAKFFADGALGSRTAWMLDAYEGSSDAGVMVDSPDLIVERGRLAVELGFVPVVHAIGDRANREVLDALEVLAPLARARGLRVRVEHAQHLHAADVARFGRLGVVVSVQPVHLPADARPAERLLGEERAGLSYAFRSLLDGGAVLALGSDAPVATPDPVVNLAAAVRREDLEGRVWHAEQALSFAEALEAYTVGSAVAAGWDGWCGRVRAGCAAEFTVWDGDPLVGPASPAEALRFN